MSKIKMSKLIEAYAEALRKENKAREDWHTYSKEKRKLQEEYEELINGVE